MAELTPQITQARTAASTAAQRAGDIAAGAPNIESELKKKAAEAYNYNQDIVKPLDEATAQYFSAPSTAREKYQDIFNPFTKEALVNKYVQQELLPVLSLSSIMGQRQGSIADLINAGVGGYQSSVLASQNAAQLARQGYQDLVGEYEIAAGTTNPYDDMLTQLLLDKLMPEDGGGGIDFSGAIVDTPDTPETTAIRNIAGSVSTQPNTWSMNQPYQDKTTGALQALYGPLSYRK